MANPPAAAHSSMRTHSAHSIHSNGSYATGCSEEGESNGQGNTGRGSLTREVHTSATIAQLQSIPNMRDLAEACSGIQPGRVFRSACPNVANTADIRLLREGLGIQQLIDLRSFTERREDAGADLLFGAEVTQTAATGKFQEWENFSRRQAAGGWRREAEFSDQLVVHHVGLIERARYFRSLVTRLPRGTVVMTAASALLSRGRARNIVLREVNRGGLPLLYEILLDSAASQLCTVLKIITRSAERGQPSLFFCKLGKDRTGITAALVLSACGATEEEIIADYTRSDAVKGIALGGLEHTKELEGLDKKAFSAAPPEAMAACLQYVKEAYGGLHAYLDYIGFNADDRDRLQAALGNERPPRDDFFPDVPPPSGAPPLTKGPPPSGEGNIQYPRSPSYGDELANSYEELYGEAPPPSVAGSAHFPEPSPPSASGASGEALQAQLVARPGEGAAGNGHNHRQGLLLVPVGSSIDPESRYGSPEGSETGDPSWETDDASLPAPGKPPVRHLSDAETAAAEGMPGDVHRNTSATSASGASRPDADAANSVASALRVGGLAGSGATLGERFVAIEHPSGDASAADVASSSDPNARQASHGADLSPAEAMVVEALTDGDGAPGMSHAGPGTRHAPGAEDASLPAAAAASGAVNPSSSAQQGLGQIEPGVLPTADASPVEALVAGVLTATGLPDGSRTADGSLPADKFSELGKTPPWEQARETSKSTGADGPSDKAARGGDWPPRPDLTDKSDQLAEKLATAVVANEAGPSKAGEPTPAPGGGSKGRDASESPGGQKPGAIGVGPEDTTWAASW
eukprot:CAMPEP_0206136990 /NCGR_PEP_ID=MMETSP1473-20131121/2180_1 /ASSEMBLY_ACC=CAM_ASM_001109 /TAXON_ID=1461547 /ORGANISM="Stichococcus sp, Strain RCC1054" /LENGTH=806 /DNA_ID=CAMNT_0053529859 /DNA_START=294 /DNA_END=2714 /DNA_ORIENTATION=+